MRNRMLYLLPALIALGAGCADQASRNREEVARIAEQHERYMQEFELAKARFEHENPMPVKVDLGEKGTLLIKDASLQGRPGTEHLYVRFSYVNTTGRRLKSATCTLTLHDRKTETEWSETMDLKLPFGFEFGHESSFTGSFRTPARGIYRQGDWDWSLDITIEPIVEEYPTGGVGPGAGRR